ncbi:hypothetical protein VF13_37855 [Nostoc linckia z16]|nr:hypothetical protein VF13_37855 [Nostoc linckia z16]
MRNNNRTFIDFYLKHPITIDIVIVIIAITVWRFVRLVPFYFPDKSTVLNIVSSVIGTCVSLAGFILAALTIIVTFRSNLKAKGVEDASNALELIISSGYYNQIVKVYTGAIYEFLIVTFGFYLFWLSIDNIKSLTILTQVVLSGVFMTAAPVIRSLWVLFSIIGSERYDKL